MRANQNQHPYYVISSLIIYICVALIFIFSFSDFLKIQKKIEPNIITEGILLPRTDFPINTTFNVDPLLTSSSVDSIRDIRKSISTLIFSTLFKENSDGTIINDLVDNYNFSNSQIITLNLRKDAKWQDGEPLKSTDIEFTIKILQGIGQTSLYSGATNGNDIQIQVIDDYSLKIILADSDTPRPNAAYIHELVFPILPKHILENYPKPSLSLLSDTDFGKNPIGSGILKYSNNKIEKLILSRNENYYGTKVGFDNYIFKFYKDYDELIKDYKLKNVDIVRRTEAGIKDDIYNKLIETGFVYSDEILRNRRLILYFNLSNKTQDSSPFNKSALLRRSLLNIINRKLIIEKTDVSKAIYGPIDEDSFSFSPDVIQKQNFNQAEFDKIVSGLGYKKVDGIYQKDSTQLKFILTYLNGGIRNPVVDQLKIQLASAGVILVAKPITENSTLSIDNADQVQSESFFSIVNNREYDALLTAVDHIMDPDVYSEWHSTKIAAPGLNLSGFSSKVADLTLEDGRIQSGNENRKADYIRFQKTFFEEVPAIYLINPGMQVFSSPRVQIIADKQLSEDINFYKDIDKWIIFPKAKSID